MSGPSVLNTSFLVGTLLLALVLVPLKVIRQGVRADEIIVLLTMVTLVGLAVTAGYHRLFSHRAYRASWPVRLFFLAFGAASFENSALKWSSDHRQHHTHVDDEAKDPYAISKGFWFAHWIWVMQAGNRPLQGVADLEQDPLVRWQNKHHFLIGGLITSIPFFIGLATGNVFGMVVMGIVLRIVLTHHTTFLINSAAHVFGTQPYTDANSARDNVFLAPLTFGEGYHNYHHMWQWDYRNGPKWYQWDPSKWLIAMMNGLGLVSGLRRVPDTVVRRARLSMESRRLAEKLSTDPTRNRLEAAQARVDQSLEGLQTVLDAWATKKKEWQEKGLAKASEWQAAKAEWKATHLKQQAELREAWSGWKAARAEALREAALA